MEDLEALGIKHCPKCGYYAGIDWEQCKGSCPIPESYHYTDRPFYVSRHVPEATQNLKMQYNSLCSTVVCAPSIGFFMISRNMKGQGKVLNTGQETIPKGFDVIKIYFDGSHRVFISGIDSAGEADDAIWGYLDACLNLGSRRP